MENKPPRQDDRLIIVGGAPRSGTTLVQNILDSHSAITGGPEFDRLPDIMRLKELLYHSIEVGRIDLYCGKGDVDRGLGDLIEGLICPYGDSKGGRYISEKTPNNVLVFSDLMPVLPRAKFIFCLRDPRAIISSLLEVGKRARKKGLMTEGYTRSLFRSIQAVRRYIYMGYKAYQEDPERVLIIKFEDLVRNPELITRDICAFLSLPWEGGMVNPGAQSHDTTHVVGAGKEADGVWYTQENISANIDEGKSSGWFKKLPFYKRVIIEAGFIRFIDMPMFDYFNDLEGKGKKGVFYSALVFRAGRYVHRKRALIRLMLVNWLRLRR